MRKFLLCLQIIPLMVNFQRSLETLVFQLFLAPLRIIMLELLYVIWVQELVLYLYKRLSLEKLTPTDISLQMADKSTAIPVGICENVPVQVATNCLILTDFVVLEMPEDDNMSIILGRPFLNTAGAVINCNQGKNTFNVNDKDYIVYFPKKIDKKYGLNSIKNIETIKVGEFYGPIPSPKKEYDIIMVGTMPIKVEVT